MIVDKSFDFALKIIDVYKALVHEKKEYVLSKQLLRSGTSIGANVNEAIEAQSKADFIHKMSISLKEARETQYWLKLLITAGLLNDANGIQNDINEIVWILTSIIKTSKKNNQ